MTRKLALCCNYVDLPPEYQNETALSAIAVWPGIFDSLSTFMLDRAECETQEQYQQLLPYIVLREKDTGKIFTYSRGGGGGESRLIGKLSIGLGGHIDEPTPDGMTLEDWCKAEAHRELKEEGGIEGDLGLKFIALLRDPTDAVGRVHMGILAIVDVSQSSIVTRLEHGVIEKGEWLSLDELHDHREQLENWSRLVATMLISDSQFLQGKADKFSFIPPAHQEDVS